MSEAGDWAASRRRRASPSRLGAAVALHAIVLLALGVAFDRVELSVRREHVGTLVPVALAPLAPPKPVVAPPPPPLPARPAAAHGRPVATPRAMPAPRLAGPTSPAPQVEAPTITVPVAAAPASVPASAALRLDAEATRLAVRDVARHPSVAGRASLADPGTPGAERLAAGVDAASKGDCSKGEFLGGGAGLLSLPFLAAAEALGKCSPH